MSKKIRERIKKVFEDVGEDDYGPKSKYTVLYGDYGYDDTDDPHKAINTWFIKEKTNSGDCAVIAFKKDDAYALVKWAHENKDKIQEWHSKFNCPYKLEYLMDSIEKHYSEGIEGYKYFHEGISGDQVDPFSFG